MLLTHIVLEDEDSRWLVEYRSLMISEYVCDVRIRACRKTGSGIWACGRVSGNGCGCCSGDSLPGCESSGHPPAPCRRTPLRWSALQGGYQHLSGFIMGRLANSAVSAPSMSTT